jgi:hypothetical protein
MVLIHKVVCKDESPQVTKPGRAPNLEPRVSNRLLCKNAAKKRSPRIALLQSMLDPNAGEAKDRSMDTFDGQTGANGQHISQTLAVMAK